jgi:cytochrome c553
MGKRAPKLLLVSGLICGIAALTLPVVGAETPMGGNLVLETEKLKKRLEARIAEVTRNPAQLRAIIDEGRERTVLCGHCHGKDGIAIQRPGLKRIVPNLAGQNPVYIIDQFKRFEDNRRQDFMMGGLAKNFTEEDMIKMAIYYSRMRPKTAGGGRADLRAKGKQIFSQICVGCHGADGKGQEGYAMIAGQRPDYVVQMLKTFRDDRERRVNPWMTGVALGLSDEDMEAVASYLANLK